MLIGSLYTCTLLYMSNTTCMLLSMIIVIALWITVCVCTIVQVSVEVSQRQQTNTESKLSSHEQQLAQQLDEESRVSQRIEDYLKKHYEELAGKVDHWMTKHEQDLDMKSRDLHELKVGEYHCW